MRLFRSPVNAPRFPEPRDWINVEQAPIMAAPTMAALRGKFVLLEFWTFC